MHKFLGDCGAAGNFPASGNPRLIAWRRAFRIFMVHGGIAASPSDGDPIQALLALLWKRAMGFRSGTHAIRQSEPHRRQRWSRETYLGNQNPASTSVDWCSLSPPAS